MKSILQICQDAASLAAAQRPENLFNTDSQQEAVFLSVANDTLDSLLRYGDWPELVRDGCLITVSGKMSYLISDFCPDFYALINNTVYVKDSSEKVMGSITPEEWARDKCFNISSLNLKFVIQNGMFRFLTPPPDGVRILFQYRSAAIVYDADCGFEEKTILDKNSDVPIFDEYLVKKGILWRWYRRNGMPYEEEFNEYEREVKNRFGTSLSTKDIVLGGGAFVPIDDGVVVYAKSVK